MNLSDCNIEALHKAKLFSTKTPGDGDVRSRVTEVTIFNILDRSQPVFALMLWNFEHIGREKYKVN